MTTQTQFRLILIVVAALLAANTPAQAQKVDPEASFQRSEAFQKKVWENTTVEVPALDKDHPSRAGTDLFTLTTENGNLILHSTLASTGVGRQIKVKVGDSTDWSLLTVVGGATGKDPVVPTSFSIRHFEFSADHYDEFATQANGGSIAVLAHQIYSAAGVTMIMFEDQHLSATQPNANGCTLTCFKSHPGRNTPPMTWSSKDFSSFLREHPAQADEYVRPLLSEFGQDAAMAPDPMEVFQVFFDQWHPDPAMIAKVNALVANLGKPEFHTRTRAEGDLAALGKPAAVVLMKMDRAKFSAEQNARIDKVLSPYLFVAPAEAAKLRNDRPFLLDCLYSDDIIIRKAALAQLQTLSRQTIAFDPAADAAARSTAISALIKQFDAAKPIGK